MVEILRRGTIYGERIHIVECSECGSRLKYKEKEVKVTHDQRDGTFITFVCPVCNKTGHCDYDKSYQKKGE